MEYSVLTPSLKAQISMQKRTQKDSKSKREMDDSKETVSSRNNWTDAHMNSQRLKQNTQDTHLFKLDGVQAKGRAHTLAIIKSGKNQSSKTLIKLLVITRKGNPIKVILKEPSGNGP